jgi:hypothetical protein
MTIETEKERYDKLVNTHGKLTIALMERGLKHAETETPAEFARAAQMLAAGVGHLQLRIDVHDGNVATSGWLIDDAGDAVVQIFAIVAAQAGMN